MFKLLTVMCNAHLDVHLSKRYSFLNLLYFRTTAQCRKGGQKTNARFNLEPVARNSGNEFLFEI